MTPMRVRMIEDMRLAGLANRTQETYVQAVAGLAKHYRRSPEQLSEEEVRRYLLARQDQGALLFSLTHAASHYLGRFLIGGEFLGFPGKGLRDS